MTLTWMEAAARAFEAPRYPTPHSIQTLITPEWSANPDYLRLIDAEMQQVLDGRNDRLMCSVPPQSGKTQRMVRAGVLWWLHHRPNDRVVISSFEASTSERWGREIRNDIEAHPELGLRLRRDSRSASRWDLEPSGGKAGGGVYCVGVGGALTGRPADLLVLDDPVKGRAWVESGLYRARQLDWWQSDARTRLGKNSKVMVIATRWHESDVLGEIQRTEPGRWRVINIPALAEANDPLGREPGEALANVRGQTKASYEETRDAIGSYAFASLYQGRPSPAEGGLFKRVNFRYWERPQGARARELQASAAPGDVILLDGTPVWLRDVRRFMTVDLAASTKSSADFTVAAVWGHTDTDQLILLDMARVRVDETQHGKIVEPLARKWGAEWVGVEDSGQAVNLSAHLGRAGIAVRPLKPVSDKVTRALPLSARVERGEFWLPQAEGTPWLDAMLSELLSFPGAGAHDDTVDVASWAARAVQSAATTAVGVPSQYAAAGFLRDLGPTPVAGRGRAGVPDFNRVQF